MDIYHFDSLSGVYLGHSKAAVDPAETQRRYNETGQNTLVFMMPAGATEKAPPEIDEHQSAVWDGKNWQVTEDYRGQTIYNTRSRAPVQVTELGPVPEGFTRDAPGSVYDTWHNGQWITDTARILADEKKRMLNLAMAYADNALASALESYPASERLSWNKQEQEALAYLDDASAETPLLSAIALERGITVYVLAEKVLAKVSAFTALSGRVFGLRQKYEARIEAATTLAELQEIQLAY